MNVLLDEYRRTVDKAQFLEASRQKMISNISHDLQTPLTAMMGYVEALSTDESLSPEERERYQGIILKKGEGLSRLFREFFELAKLEADDALLQLVPVNLPEKVDEVVTAFCREFEQQGVMTEIDIPFEPLFVLGDPRLIDRILYNLISNSLRYGRAGGMIGVTVQARAERIRVEVWDRGRGISAQDLRTGSPLHLRPPLHRCGLA